MSNFSTNGKTPNGKQKYKPRCKVCDYAEQRRFSAEKQDLIKDLYGTSCVVCGYDKCYAALEFHHVDMSTKEYQISKLVGNFSRIDTLLKELEKCILVCSNCHREIHHPHQI